MLEKIIKQCKNKDLLKLEERILAQLRYASVLSKADNNKYESIIKNAEDYIIDCIRKTNGLTMENVNMAENILSPVANEAKEYEILCVAHAHIDMNWLWGYDETVGVTVDTFRTMLDIMSEYPDFKFSQSQASVYRIIEEYYPEMFEEIKARVKEGRWEITSSTWVETDKNMPNGESLSRHILYTKDYISKTFDISKDDLQIDFEPDTFGHNKNVPAILNEGGVKFYYHCRGYEFFTPLYKWVSPSNQEILVYCEPYWYNAEITSSIVDEVPILAKKTNSKTILKVYGVGDHGGGPTRRDINRLIDYSTYPIFPKIKFSTFKEYYKSVEHLIDTVPVINKEQNFLCDGCYTTQSIIKQGNRKSEAMLFESEALSSFATLHEKMLSKNESFKTAWRNVLFNQFHDIIPGSGVTTTREYASGLYQNVFATAQTNQKIAVKNIIDNIDTSTLFAGEDVLDTVAESQSEGGGAGYGECSRNCSTNRIYHIFNNTPYSRKNLALLNIWDYEGDINSIGVYNQNDEKISHQKIGNNIHYWGHNLDTVLVDVSVPAFGYTTVYLKEELDHKFLYNHHNDMRVQHVDEFILENELMRVEFNSLDGSIKSIFDKNINKEIVTNKKTAIFKMANEAINKQVTGWNGGMSAWFAGRYKHIEVIENFEIKMVESGKDYQSVLMETTIRNTKLSITASLSKGSNNIEFKLNCDYREFGSSDSFVPTLLFSLPTGYKCNNYIYDVPFGVENRPAMDMDNPANSFIFAKSETELSSLMLISKTKYGFRGIDDSINLTLIRGAYDPDPTPEAYVHEIEFAVSLVPTNSTNKELIKNSFMYNHPLQAVSGKQHKGNLSLENNFIDIISESACVSSVKLCENDSNKLVIRLYETQGNTTEVIVKTKHNISSGYFTDINEDKELGSIDVIKNTAAFTIKPYSINTIILL